MFGLTKNTKKKLYTGLDFVLNRYRYVATEPLFAAHFLQEFCRYGGYLSVLFLCMLYKTYFNPNSLFLCH